MSKNEFDELGMRLADLAGTAEAINKKAYSLADAAVVCGVNKSTILRAIQAGKISATKNAHGEWLVASTNLHQVYPTPETSVEYLELKTALGDMRRQRDSWQRMAEALIEKLKGIS